MARDQNTYDNLLLLKDAGAVVADGAATVAAAPRVLDLGLANAGSIKAVIDTSAIDRTTGDETYRVSIQGSVDLAFTAPVELASTLIDQVGRVELPVSNSRGGTIYRYIRAFNDVGGTTPSINSTVFLAKA